MTLNMILFSVTIKVNHLNKADYISLKKVEDEILDRKLNNFNRSF